MRAPETQLSYRQCARRAIRGTGRAGVLGGATPKRQHTGGAEGGTEARPSLPARQGGTEARHILPTPFPRRHTAQRRVSHIPLPWQGADQSRRGGERRARRSRQCGGESAARHPAAGLARAEEAAVGMKRRPHGASASGVVSVGTERCKRPHASGRARARAGAGASMGRVGARGRRVRVLSTAHRARDTCPHSGSWRRQPPLQYRLGQTRGTHASTAARTRARSINQ